MHFPPENPISLGFDGSSLSKLKEKNYNTNSQIFTLKLTAKEIVVFWLSNHK